VPLANTKRIFVISLLIGSRVILQWLKVRKMAKCVFVQIKGCGGKAKTIA